MDNKGKRRAGTYRKLPSKDRTHEHYNRVRNELELTLCPEELAAIADFRVEYAEYLQSEFKAKGVSFAELISTIAEEWGVDASELGIHLNLLSNASKKDKKSTEQKVDLSAKATTAPEIREWLKKYGKLSVKDQELIAHHNEWPCEANLPKNPEAKKLAQDWEAVGMEALYGNSKHNHSISNKMLKFLSLGPSLVYGISTAKRAELDKKMTEFLVGEQHKK